MRRPRLVLVIGAACVATLWAVGCSFAALDEAGEECGGSNGTCDPPYACVSGVCAIPHDAATLDAADESADGAVESGFRPDAPPSTIISVGELRSAWATPNSIRWEWTLSGDAGSVATYELALHSMSNPDASGVKTWTSNDNPELSGAILKLGSGPVPVSGTITDSLDPNTDYEATLYAYDVQGGVATTTSPPATTDSTRTLQATIFGDALLSGEYLIPVVPQALFVDSNCGPPPNPAACLHFVFSEDDASAAGTYDTVRVENAGANVGTLSSFAFKYAYVEFWVRSKDGTPKSEYSEIRLATYVADEAGTECNGDPQCLYRYAAKWVYSSSSQYRRVQIPLSQFALDVDGGGGMTPDILALGIDEFGMGAAFDPTEEAFIGSVGIWF